MGWSGGNRIKIKLCIEPFRNMLPVIFQAQYLTYLGKTESRHGCEIELADLAIFAKLERKKQNF